MRSRILAVYLAATAIVVVEKLLNYSSYGWLDPAWLAALAGDVRCGT